MRLSTDDLPMFFDPSHVALARRLVAAAPALAAAEEVAEDARDRAAVDALARAGLFELVVPADGRFDARSLCLAREMIAYVSPRADSIFAVQGLGVHAIITAGSDEQRAQLTAFARGAGI